MIAWFTKNHVAANLLLISILMMGLFSLSSRIPLEIFPSIESDVISVNMSLRGATPEDVEKGISIRIEEAVQDLEGIEKISSRSSEGSANVSIEVDDGYDARELLADIKSRVDAINTFPAEAEKPVIAINQRIRDVITVTIATDYGELELREYAERVRDDMLRLPGVTQMTMRGVRDYEIAIEVSEHKLRQYNITLNQVSAAIGSNSIDISAGNLRTSGGDILLRSKGQAYRKDEFSKIVIKQNSDGNIIRLEDVATINDGFEEYPIRARFNGKQAAFINVYRIGNQSAIDVADKIKNYIQEQQAVLPTGYELSYWDDDSLIVKKRLATLTSSALQGGLLVLLLLTLFLRPAVAFWVFLGIPISFMGAFIVMPFFGVTLNIISLFGFILVLGIVVDDAIVTGENVYSRMKTSKNAEEAAIIGTQEVATPVTFGVLTTVVAFLPLAFMEGGRAALFAQLPVVIIPVLLFSLIESKFVLPAHLKYIKMRDESKPNRLSRIQQNFADGFERVILKYYQPQIDRALRNKGTTIMLFISAFLIVLSLILSGWSKFTFFPRIPSETVSVNLTMPTGTPFEVTDKYISHIADQVEIIRDKYVDENGDSIVMNVLSRSGGRGGATNEGVTYFEITPPEEREMKIGSRDLLIEWRKLIGEIPGAETLSFRAEIGRSSDPIDIQLSATSIELLQTVSEKVKQRLATYPVVYDITDSISNGKQEIQIELTEQGHALGITRNDISSQVRTAYFGSQVQRIQRGRDDVRVMVRLPLQERKALSTLENMMINTPQGGQVPLSHVAKLFPGQSPSAIYRIDRYRVVSITADVNKSEANMTVINQDISNFLRELVSQYPGLSFKLEGEAKEQRESMTSLIWGLGFVLFIIYCLLAIPFKSYWQPMAVMSVIPFGVLGAIIGHWIMGMTLTIMSVLGMLALIGVIVNDSLVLVDYINKKRSEGMTLSHAISTAGAARFRPVMLTSLTTFIGLMPLLFEESTQAQFLIPMAVSLGFGIIFATLITLILVPVNYYILEKFAVLVTGKKEHVINESNHS